MGTGKDCIQEPDCSLEMANYKKRFQNLRSRWRARHSLMKKRSILDDMYTGARGRGPTALLKRDVTPPSDVRWGFETAYSNVYIVSFVVAKFADPRDIKSRIFRLTVYSPVSPVFLTAFSKLYHSLNFFIPSCPRTSSRSK